MKTFSIIATLAAASASLSGCAAAPDLIGLGVGGTAGALTSNPAVAIGVGIATRAAVRETFSYAARERAATDQSALARAAGSLEPGASAGWNSEHLFALGNLDGQLQVLRLIETPLATCKEIAYRIGGDPAVYVTQICPGQNGWSWGTAEPAVGRWGTLQ